MGYNSGGLVAARAVAAAGRNGYIKPSVAASVLAPLPSSGQLLLELLDSGLERGLLIATWVTEYRETAGDQACSGSSRA